MVAKDETSVTVSNKDGYGHTRIRIVCPDRVGLLNDLTSYLAKSGVDVLEADVSTSDNNWATDVFKVVDTDSRGPVPLARLQALRDALNGMVEKGVQDGNLHVGPEAPGHGSSSDEEEISPKHTKKQGAERPGPKEEGGETMSKQDGVTWVEVSNEVHARCTVMKLEAEDRPGLLASVMLLLKEKEISIMQAKIKTEGSRVVDYFYLVSSRSKNKVKTKLLKGLLVSMAARVTRRAFQDMNAETLKQSVDQLVLRNHLPIPEAEKPRVLDCILQQELPVPAVLEKAQVCTELVERMRVMHFPMGAVIINDGAKASNFCFVAKGTVKRIFKEKNPRDKLRFVSIMRQPRTSDSTAKDSEEETSWHGRDSNQSLQGRKTTGNMLEYLGGNAGPGAAKVMTQAPRAERMSFAAGQTGLDFKLSNGILPGQASIAELAHEERITECSEERQSINRQDSQPRRIVNERFSKQSFAGGGGKDYSINQFREQTARMSAGDMMKEIDRNSWTSNESSAHGGEKLKEMRSSMGRMSAGRLSQGRLNGGPPRTSQGRMSAGRMSAGRTSGSHPPISAPRSSAGTMGRPVGARANSMLTSSFGTSSWASIDRRSNPDIMNASFGAPDSTNSSFVKLRREDLHSDSSRSMESASLRSDSMKSTTSNSSDASGSSTDRNLTAYEEGMMWGINALAYPVNAECKLVADTDVELYVITNEMFKSLVSNQISVQRGALQTAVNNIPYLQKTLTEAQMRVVLDSIWMEPRLRYEPGQLVQDAGIASIGIVVQGSVVAAAGPADSPGAQETVFRGDHFGTIEPPNEKIWYAGKDAAQTTVVFCSNSLLQGTLGILARQSMAHMGPKMSTVITGEKRTKELESVTMAQKILDSMAGRMSRMSGVLGPSSGSSHTSGSPKGAAVASTARRCGQEMNINQFSIFKRVGKGLTAEVFASKWHVPPKAACVPFCGGNEVWEDKGVWDEVKALKVVVKSHAVQHLPDVMVLVREREALELLDGSAYIPRFRAFFKDAYALYFVQDFAAGGTLFQRLAKTHLEPDACRYAGACVLLALQWMHARGYVHRDLKLENVVLTSRGVAQLTDMGFARRLSPGQRAWSWCGTPDYAAPEMICHLGTAFPADLWAFGVFLYELNTGFTPFSGSTVNDLFDRILHFSRISFPDNVPSVTKDLVRKLLVRNEFQRLGYSVAGGGADGDATDVSHMMADVQAHQYFDSIDWEAMDAGTFPPPKSLVSENFEVNMENTIVPHWQQDALKLDPENDKFADF